MTDLDQAEKLRHAQPAGHPQLHLPRTLTHLPHITAAVAALVIAAGVALLELTHVPATSAIPISVLLTAVFAAVPMSVSQAVGTELSGLTAGITLRREGIMPPAGSHIIVPGYEGNVTAHALRHITLATAHGRAFIPNTTLLAGFELVATPEVPPQ